MNILLVAEHFYPYGGAELFLWKLCGALSRKGHRLYVITARRSGEASFEIEDGVEIYRPFPTGNIVRRFLFSLKLYLYLKKWLRDKKIDLIFNLGYVPTLSATYTAARHSIPAVTLLGHLCGRQWFRLTNPISALLNYITEIVIVRFGKHGLLVVQCQDSAEKVANYTAAEIVVICCTFLEPDVFKEARESTNVNGIRQSLHIGDDELFLLFVGALIPTKNVTALVKTIAGLRVNFRLVLVGDGPERANIDGLVKRLDLERKVVLLGQKSHDETLAIMRSCDALFLPSICEQVPNVILEALALGRPVIATRVGGVSEIKSANLNLINSLEEINKILENGIETHEEDGIVAQYSIDNVTNQYEKLFLRLTSSKLKTKNGII